jgi:hypothetical protein
LTFADEQGVSLDIETRPESICGQQYDTVIYDPDSFPPDERAANLTTVLACPVNRPVAVHSYDISVDQLHLLRRWDAIVARRFPCEGMDPGRLFKLARMVPCRCRADHGGSRYDSSPDTATVVPSQPALLSGLLQQQTILRT